MRKSLTLAVVVLVATVALGAASTPAEACTSHGLVHAVTLDDLYSEIPELSFSFTHHGFSVHAAGSPPWSITGIGGGNSISPNLGSIESFIEGVLPVLTDTTNATETDSRTDEESDGEQNEDFAG